MSSLAGEVLFTRPAHVPPLGGGGPPHSTGPQYLLLSDLALSIYCRCLPWARTC